MVVGLQAQKNNSQLNLRIGQYRAILMTPELVSDDWVRWIGDPFMMTPLGMKPRIVDRPYLQQYVMQMHAKQRALIGVFQESSRRHVGIIEVGFDRKHFTAHVELFLDITTIDFSAVAKEVVPELFQYLAQRFKIEKFCASVPETHLQAIRYFQEYGWELEAVLTEEMPAPALKRRINMQQFGWTSPNLG